MKIKGRKAHVEIDARRLAKGLPHAQHLHFGADARNECPSVFDDTNNDHRLNVAEGVPAYGPILKSLTTSGDTSPKSGLAVDRFPTTPKGVEEYERTISFAPGAVLRAIKSGKGVIVIHGVDHNGNGEYDFDGAAPASSTRACRPRPPTPPCAACCADPYDLTVARPRPSRGGVVARPDGGPTRRRRARRARATARAARARRPRGRRRRR